MQLGELLGGKGRWTMESSQRGNGKGKCCGRKLATTTKKRRPIARRWRGAMPGAYGTWHGCLPAWGRNKIVLNHIWFFHQYLTLTWRPLSHGIKHTFSAAEGSFSRPFLPVACMYDGDALKIRLDTDKDGLASRRFLALKWEPCSGEMINLTAVQSLLILSAHSPSNSRHLPST
jgi:hypothetical protein